MGESIRAKMNVLCVLAVMLGVVSLFLPWITVKQGSATLSQDYLVQDILLSGRFVGPEFMAVCSFFVAGLLLSLITPAAGFLELTGAIGILALYPAGYRDLVGEPIPSLGVVVGLCSALVVVVSLYFPLGPGYGSFRNRRYVGQANRLLTMSRLEATAKLRLNALCLAGALLALVAIGLPWFTHQTISSQPLVTQNESHSLYMVLDQSFGIEAMLAALIFLGGTALAFVTPLGGIAQAIGVLWFFQTRYLIVGTLLTPGWIDRNYFDSGFYVAIVATGLVLVSMFLPLGIGYILRRKTLAGRLVVWGQSASRL